MLDRKMYISAAMLMFAALFLFQLSGVSKQAFSDYTRNRFAEEQNESGGEETVENLFDPVESGASSAADGTVVWLGEEDEMYRTALQWCTYRRYILETDLDAEADPVLVLVEGEMYEDYQETVTEAVTDSIPVVFCGLPSSAEIEADDSLRELLGIDEVRGAVTLEGVQLRSGFLLGGEKDYVLDPDADEEEQRNQDLDLSAVWYVPGSGTETYLAGVLSEETYGEILPQYLPPLIWRHSTEELLSENQTEEGDSADPYTSAVFAVSSGYLQDETGLGILTAIVSKTEQYSLYPVVNAQSFILEDFPSLSSENQEQMMTLYSRGTQSVIRDIVWPGIETILDRTEAIPTYMIVPFLEDSSAVESEELDDYMQRIRETRGEAGISLRVAAGLPAQTLSSDKTILNDAMPDYRFSTLYGRGFDKDTVGKALDDAGLTDVRAILLDRNGSGTDLLSVISSGDGTVSRSVVRNIETADTHTFSEDLRMRSVETALGYSMLSENLGKVLYPESTEDQWQNLSEQVSGNTVHYWDGFTAFEKTSLSETGARALSFLTERTSSSREGDTIRITRTGTGEGYFVLRLYGEEAVSAEGGSLEEIEDGSWLVTMDGSEMTVTVRVTGAR